MLYLDDLRKRRPDSYHYATGTMRENIANLSAEIVEELTALYEGTNLGMQELDGIMVEDVEGALMASAQIGKHRQDQRSTAASIVALSIDPGFSSKETADEVGMVIGQKLGVGNTAIAEVIDDFSRRYGEGWGDLVVDKCVEHGVSVVLFEGNMVGQWVREALEEAFRARGVTKPRIESVTSKKSKWARAEPVAALAQKGRYRMVGTFAKLESELTSWVPDKGMRSPNRLDAWAQLGRYFLIKHGGTGAIGKKPTRRVPSIG
jgi:phage terminase large subunit-like protein